MGIQLTKKETKDICFISDFNRNLLGKRQLTLNKLRKIIDYHINKYGKNAILSLSIFNECDIYYFDFLDDMFKITYERKLTKDEIKKKLDREHKKKRKIEENINKLSRMIKE